MKALLLGVAFLGFLLWIRARNNQPPEHFRYEEWTVEQNGVTESGFTVEQ